MTQIKQYYRTHLIFLRLRVYRPLSVDHSLSVHRSLSVNRQNISNEFKKTAIDRMFLYILPFFLSTIYTKLYELTLLPNANSILAKCDGGGSNNPNHYIFKEDLHKLVNEIGIKIRIAHYPPYIAFLRKMRYDVTDLNKVKNI